MIAIERTGALHGVPHVLGGIISPMDGIGPEDLLLGGLSGASSEGGDRRI